MSEMKCCPECGSNDLSLINIIPHAYIYCKGCGYTGQLYDSRAEAISAWNEIKIERKTTETKKTHRIGSFQKTSLRYAPIGISMRKLQKGLMKELSKVLLTAAAEGKYVLIHPITYSQHEDAIGGWLEIKREISYETLDDGTTITVRKE